MTKDEIILVLDWAIESTKYALSLKEQVLFEPEFFEQIKAYIEDSERQLK